MGNEADYLPPSLVRTADVIGVNVQNMQGEDLGEVEEIILDKVNGHVVYVVLSFGGILGLADKFFALPWKLFRYDDDKNAFVINLEKQKLKDAPGFDKNNWPNMTDDTWRNQINQFYDVDKTY